MANSQNPGNGRERSLGARLLRYSPFYVMFTPVMIILVLFHYLPMLGIRYSLYKFNPFIPEPVFIGFENFRKLFISPRFWAAFNNTLILSFVNLCLSMIFSVGIALLINEIGNALAKKFVQTVIYLPHFLSWVVVAGIFALLLSNQSTGAIAEGQVDTGGLVNTVLIKLHIINEPVYWLTEKSAWRFIWYFINRWKETGWGTIIFLAAITGISPELYEAAEIDGAGKLRQVWYITIPCLLETILVVFILNLAKIMNVFESVFVLYNALVYDVSDVIQTYTYRVGLQGGSNYGYSTAVGLFKSVISLVLVSAANFASSKVRGRGII